MIFRKKTTSIYLDHASSTPVDPRVLKVMEKTMKESWHNPSALYKQGVHAHRLLTDARTSIARFFGAHSDEIIFTGSGTESDNLAILGVIQSFKQKNHGRNPHIITTPIEHSAVRESIKSLESWGCAVSYLSIDESGIVDPSELKKLITEDTVLVSIHYANNEIGVVQPITELAKVIRHYRRHHDSVFPLFHTDAVQAVQYLPCRVESLGVDLLSANGSKIYGPRGIGMLYKKRSVEISPMLHGGNQEFGFRPGTESLDRIVGFAEALRIVEDMKEEESIRLSEIRDYAFARLTETFPECVVNGSQGDRLPNNISISLPQYDSEFLVLELDAKGIAVSSKSACTSDEPSPSYVIAALRPGMEDTSGSLRITLGRDTKKGHIDTLIHALTAIHAKQSRLLR